MLLSIIVLDTCSFYLSLFWLAWPEGKRKPLELEVMWDKWAYVQFCPLPHRNLQISSSTILFWKELLVDIVILSLSEILVQFYNCICDIFYCVTFLQCWLMQREWRVVSITLKWPEDTHWRGKWRFTKVSQSLTIGWWKVMKCLALAFFQSFLNCAECGFGWISVIVIISFMPNSDKDIYS